MPIIRVKNPLIFPGGTPSFNSSHFAIRGNSKFNLSFVPTTSGFYSLTDGQRLVNSGTTSNNFFGSLGRTVSPGGGTNTITYTSAYTGAPGTGGFTFATFFYTNTASAGANQTLMNFNDVNFVGFSFHSNTAPYPLDFFDSVTDHLTGNVISANTPYFVIISTLFTAPVNFTWVNLFTGQIFNSAVAWSGGAFPNLGGSIRLGNLSGGAQPFLGGMGPTCLLDSYLSLQEQARWAAAPWDFWYPPKQLQAAALRAPLSTVVKSQFAELPPVLKRTTPDLLTAFQQGFIVHGPKAGTPFADLPPLGWGPPDLKTSYIDGFITHGAKAGRQSADLPPLGRGPPDLKTSYLDGFITHGPKQGAQSADLPPLGQGPTIDLRTAFLSGFHGAARGGPIQADLPPFGVGATVDNRTSYQSGYISHGAVAGSPISELPPFGRGPTIDLRTAFQPGFILHGATAGTQSVDLPVVRASASPDILTWFMPGTTAAVVAPVAALPGDASLPPLGRQPTIDLRTSYQAGSYGATAGGQSAELPPLGRGPPTDLRTWFIPGFFGPPFIVTQYADLPPLGRGPPDLKTSYLDGFITHGAKAGGQSADLPPLGRGPPDLKTSYLDGFITHGARASGPIDASLPPVGRGPSIELTTSYQSGSQTVLNYFAAVGDGNVLTWTVSGNYLNNGQLGVNFVIGNSALGSGWPPVQTFDTAYDPFRWGFNVDFLTSYISTQQQGGPLAGPGQLQSPKFRADVGGMMTHMGG